MTKAYKFVEDHRAKYTDSVVGITHDVGTIHGLLDGMKGGLSTKQATDKIPTIRQYLDRIIGNKMKLREVCGTLVDRYAAIDKINDSLHEENVNLTMENDHLKRQHKEDKVELENIHEVNACFTEENEQLYGKVEEAKDEVVQMQRRLDKLLAENEELKQKREYDAKRFKDVFDDRAAKTHSFAAAYKQLEQRLAAVRLALPDGSTATMAAADRAPSIIINNLRYVLNNVEYLRKVKPRDNESLDDFADRLDAAVATSVQYARDGAVSAEDAVRELQQGYEVLRKAFKDAGFIHRHEQMADVVLPQTAATDEEPLDRDEVLRQVATRKNVARLVYCIREYMMAVADMADDPYVHADDKATLDTAVKNIETTLRGIETTINRAGV